MPSNADATSATQPDREAREPCRRSSRARRDAASLRRLAGGVRVRIITVVVGIGLTTVVGLTTVGLTTVVGLTVVGLTVVGLTTVVVTARCGVAGEGLDERTRGLERSWSQGRVRQSYRTAAVHRDRRIECSRLALAGHSAAVLSPMLDSRDSASLTRPTDLAHATYVAFQDELAKHIEQIRNRIPFVRHEGERSSPTAGEEATKQALVVPLLQVLGYDVFDPREVRPEYIADFAVKKSGQFEKVDYAIFLGGKPALFVECKALGASLQDNGGQLARYFNADPDVRVGIITDGVRIRVYTDLQQPNLMDPTPWLDIDLLNIKPEEVESLRNFRKADFVPADVSRLAEETVYYNSILKTVAEQLREPSESFIRWIAGELPDVPRVTVKLVERLTPILRRAIQSAIVDHVARSFARPPEVSAPDPSESNSTDRVDSSPLVESSATPSSEAKPGVVTTAEELEVARIVGGWVREVRPDASVAHRDGKGYFTLHQSNLRKWFARLNLDRKPGWVALRHVTCDEGRVFAPGVDVFDGGSFGASRFALTSLDDMPKLRTAILTAYEREASRVGEETGDADSA